MRSKPLRVGSLLAGFNTTWVLKTMSRLVNGTPSDQIASRRNR
jgi:hypothetical protein